MSSHTKPWRPWGHHPGVVILGSIAALVVIATGGVEVWNWRHDRVQGADSSLGSPSRQGESPKVQPPAALSSLVTLQELAAYVYEEYHTSAQVDDFIDRHLNRSVVWDGWVGNVSRRYDGAYSVILMPAKGSMSGLAYLTFPSAYRADLLGLNYGQKVRVSGTFSQFDSRFHLEKCALLQVSPVSR